MYKTLLLLTVLALVQARPNEDAVVTNAKLHEVLETGPARSSNADDCETLDNGCPVDYTIHKIIPHEYDCHLFYVCDKGERVVLPCPQPLYFDTVSERCVWSWQTDCVNSDPPATAVDIEATSPAADFEATTAAADIEGTTARDFDIGDVLENGCPADIHIHHLLPHEECEKFYQCNFGEKVERDCAPGTVFHFEIQVCDWPRNVPRCAGSPGATARPPTTPGSEEPPTTSDPVDWEPLPNGCPADSSITHLLPHESECDKYYVCSNGRLVEMECPTATHFSPSQQKCTWPHEAGCEHWTGGCSNPGGGGSCGGSTGTPDNSTTLDPNNSTTPSEELTTTTEPPCNSEGTVVDSSTTPAGPTDGNGTTIDSTVDSDISTTLPTEVPENSTTTAEPIESSTVGITTEPSTNVPENSTTTAEPIESSTVEITTEPSTDVPENSTTTAEPIESSTIEITTEPSTDVPENSTTTAEPIESTTVEITTEPSTDVPENSTTTAEPIESTTVEITTEPSTDVPENSTTTAKPIESTTVEITTESSTGAPDTTTATEAPPCDTEGSGDGTTATPGCPICPTVPVSPAERCKQGCNVAPWAHEECDKYYSCIGDEFRLNICAEGLHFNPSTLTCDFICNAGCVRNVPQITRYPDGVLMFVPNIVNSKMNMIELIEHELNGDL